MSSVASTAGPTLAVIPAAGLGTRLRPLSDAIPKEMLPVGRRLALEAIVDELAAGGVTHCVFVLSPQKESFIRGHFGDGRSDMTFEYVLQTQMRGLGDAILQARDAVGVVDDFLIALGDAVFVENAPGALVRRLGDVSEPIAIAVQTVPPERLSRYGVVAPTAAVDEKTAVSFAISDIVEKPAPENAPSSFAVTARYRVPGMIFAALQNTPPAKNGEVQLTDALRMLLSSGVAGRAVPLLPGEARHDIGGFDTYYKAFVTLALRDPEFGESLRKYLKEELR